METPEFTDSDFYLNTSEKENETFVHENFNVIPNLEHPPERFEPLDILLSRIEDRNNKFDLKELELFKQFQQELKELKTNRTKNISKLESLIERPHQISLEEMEEEWMEYDEYLYDLGRKQAGRVIGGVKTQFLKTLDKTFKRPLEEDTMNNILEYIANNYDYNLTEFFKSELDFSQKKHFFTKSNIPQNQAGWFDGISQKDISYEETDLVESLVQDYLHSKVFINQVINETENLFEQGHTDISLKIIENYFKGFLQYFQLDDNIMSRIENLKKTISAKLIEPLIPKLEQNLLEKIKKNYAQKEKEFNDFDENSSSYQIDIWDLSSDFSNNMFHMANLLDYDIDLKKTDKLIESYNQRLENAILGRKQFLARKIKLKEIKVQKKQKQLEERLNNLTCNSPQFEKGSIGKIILYFTPENNSMELGILEFPKEKLNIPDLNDKQALRDLFRSYVFSNELGYHANIKRPKNSKVLGGGAYVVINPKLVHVDYSSGSYGKIPLILLQKCLDENGYELSILDEKFFTTGLDLLEGMLKN